MVSASVFFFSFAVNVRLRKVFIWNVQIDVDVVPDDPFTGAQTHQKICSICGECIANHCVCHSVNLTSQSIVM